MASTNFINDCISDIDYLGYLPYIEAFEYIICNHSELMNLPVVFGIHGKWGVGKSTFMNLIKKKLDYTGKFFTIELNPWEYGKENNFVSTFLAKLYTEAEKDLCNKEKKQDDIVYSLFKSIIKPLKLSADFKLGKVEYDFSKLNFDSQKQFVDDFISENYALKETIKTILEEAEIFDTKKIVVFIDDLDRCPTDKVIEVIESIKLVLNSKNCIFFLGCDKEYLENALNVKYKEFLQFLEKEKDVADHIMENYHKNYFKNFSREYLEKIIQVPFTIPPLNESCIMTFIDCILNSTETIKHTQVNYNPSYYDEFRKGLAQELLTKLSIEANINPRRIKRLLSLLFLNYVFIRFKFKDNRYTYESIDLDILSFLGFIRNVEPEYYKAFLSGNICKSVFRDHFSVFKKSQKNNGDEDIRENNKYFSNNSVNEYFKIFFESLKLKNDDMLVKKLENVSTYISVSNITTSEDYKANNWGTVGEIRSEITNKRISVFLNRIKGNEVVQDFIIWFFENIYHFDKYIIGIQKNIHLYKKVPDSKFDLDNNFLSRFEYSEKEKKLFIRFERGSNLTSVLSLKLQELYHLKNYEKAKKQVIVHEATAYKDIDELKKVLENLFLTI